MTWLCMTQNKVENYVISYNNNVINNSILNKTITVGAI